MKRPRASCWLCAVFVGFSTWSIGLAAADDSLSEARKLFLTGKYADARQMYSRLAKKQPAQTAVGIAQCFRAEGQLDKAVKTLKTAQKNHGKNASIPALLARLAMESGRFDDAQQWVTTALKLEKNQLLARWIQGEIFRSTGKLAEAKKAYKWLFNYYNQNEVNHAESLHWVALGATQYIRWNRLSNEFNTLVNQIYPEILKLEPGYWPAHYEAGMLFLEKYNQPDANQELNTALELNPNAAEVHAARAMLALQSYDLAQAKASIETALEINPRLLMAQQFKADLLFVNFQTLSAVKVLNEALKLNPVSEQTLGRLAAAYGTLDGLPDGLSSRAPAGTRLGKIMKQVTHRNEHAGVFYATLAASLDKLQRYPSSARYYQRAIEAMPQLVGPRGQLGLMYMRLGQEDEATKVLNQSFEIDPFNVRVKNTLAVLDVLKGYETIETEHFIIKFDPKHDKVLARSAAEYLERDVYPSLCKQLGYHPPEKSLFEIFSRAKNTDGHGWFSARMVGLPYIGTVGACAGKMVAITSPNDMKEPFNWARVLKHEFIHVVNLQQTNFNIPHWFTEALAVLNEGYPRPQIWNDLLIARVPEGKLFNLDTINLGFVRPQSSLEWNMAYCQAELYAQYMLDHFGPDSLAKMLAAYADNLSTRKAIQQTLKVSQEEFEKGYVKYLKDVVAGLPAGTKTSAKSIPELEKARKANPKDADITAQLALAYVRRRSYAKARQLADAALKLRPKHQLATYVRARLHLLIGETSKALELLEGCLDRNAPQENVLALLAGLKLKANQYKEAAELYQLGARKNPTDMKWIKSLAQTYLKSKNNKPLIEVLEKLALQDADNFTARKKLAMLYFDAKDYTAAVRWSNEAIQVNVMDALSHQIRAKSLVAGAKHHQAIGAFELAIELTPKDLQIRFALADACLHAGEKDKARQALEALIRRDPDYPGAKQLLENIKP